MFVQTENGRFNYSFINTLFYYKAIRHIHEVIRNFVETSTQHASIKMEYDYKDLCCTSGDQKEPHM